MVARVNYSREGAGSLVEYIERGSSSPVRDETGRELDAEKREWFVRRSEEHGFTRSVVLSLPAEADARLSDRDVERETRGTMNEQLADAPSARYVYGIHEDTEHTHAHVALTGEERDLTWSTRELDQLRETADERFIERHRPDREPEREPVPNRNLDRDRALGRDRDLGELAADARDRRLGPADLDLSEQTVDLADLDPSERSDRSLGPDREPERER